jgi:zinc D-Ala-D-Ala carboxypeptidase
MSENAQNLNKIILGLLVVSILASGYLLFLLQKKQTAIVSLESEKSAFLKENASSTEALAIASSTLAQLESELFAIKEEFGILNEDYTAEQDRNDDFEKQIKKIGKTVGILDKLSKTDEELLQKYSKVYFLNEHYVPESLKQIDNEWKYTEAKDLKLHSKVVPYFNDMVKDAKAEGVDLWVVSAYRSFGDQETLKGQYVTTYGSGANTFSADQGYSEHQLGTTLDFTTKGLGGGLDGFGSTPAYTWLQAHAHEYGFTLSYPEGNSYYTYEPWHWRFVGEDLADDMNDAGAHFYDWDQRKIDGYLVKIFD